MQSRIEFEVLQGKDVASIKDELAGRLESKYGKGAWEKFVKNYSFEISGDVGRCYLVVDDSQVQLLLPVIKSLGSKIGRIHVSTGIHDVSSIFSKATSYLFSGIFRDGEKGLLRLEKAVKTGLGKFIGKSSLLYGDLDSDIIILVKSKEEALHLINKGFKNVIEVGSERVLLDWKTSRLLNNKILIFLSPGRDIDKRILNELREKIDLDFFAFTYKNKDIIYLNSKEIRLSLENRMVNTIKPSLVDKVKFFLGFKKKFNKRLVEIIKSAINSNEYFLLDRKYRVIGEGGISAFLTSAILKDTKYLVFDGILERSVIKKIEKSGVKLKGIFCRKTNLSIKKYDIHTFGEVLDSIRENL